MCPRTPGAGADRAHRSITDSAACRTPAAPRVRTSEPAEHVLQRGMALNIHDSSSLRRPLPTYAHETECAPWPQCLCLDSHARPPHSV